MFVRQQEKYSLAEKKELGELDKNLTPPPPPRLFQPPRLIHFAIFSNPPPLAPIKIPPSIWDRKVIPLRLKLMKIDTECRPNEYYPSQYI